VTDGNRRSDRYSDIVSAQENLSPYQFMSMRRLGKLPSVDRQGQSLHEYATDENANLEPPHVKAFEDQEALTDHIAAHGMQEPISISLYYNKPMVTNGRHRFVAAHDLGMAKVPVLFAPGAEKATKNFLGHYTPPAK
jgi:hypothetical protein